MPADHAEYFSSDLIARTQAKGKPVLLPASYAGLPARQKLLDAVVLYGEEKNFVHPPYIGIERPQVTNMVDHPAQ